MRYGNSGPTFGPDCGCQKKPGGRTFAGAARAPVGGLGALPTYGAPNSGASQQPYSTPWYQEAASALVDIGKKIFGGSSSTSCPGQIPPSVLSTVLGAATPAELAQWDTLIRATRPSWYAGMSALPLAQLSFALAGGSDCKVTSNEGRALVAFAQAQVYKYAGVSVSGSGTIGPDTSGASGIDGGPNNNPILYTGTTPQNQSTLDKVKALLVKAATVGLTAAENTLLMNTYAQLPKNQQALVRGSVLDQYKTPLLVGAGVLAAYLIFRPRAAR